MPLQPAAPQFRASAHSFAWRNPGHAAVAGLPFARGARAIVPGVNRKGGHYAIISGIGAVSGLRAFAGGTGYAHILIPVRCVQEAILAANDHDGTRQETGQMPEVRQSQGPATVRALWRKDLEEELTRMGGALSMKPQTRIAGPKWGHEPSARGYSAAPCRTKRGRLEQGHAPLEKGETSGRYRAEFTHCSPAFPAKR